MSTLAPLMRDQRKIDEEHLRLLAVFHFVMGGFALLGLALLFAHWFMMQSVFADPAMWKNQPGSPSPEQFFATFKWFYVILGSGIVLAGIANVASGWLIRKRRARALSLVVAGLNCMGVPFATVLGVFAFVVLLRDSVAELYEAAGDPAPPISPGPAA
jgi:hypothetical protein